MNNPYNEVTPIKMGSGTRKSPHHLQSEQTTPLNESINDNTHEVTNTNNLDKTNNWPQSLQNFLNSSFLRAGSLDNEKKVTFNQQLQVLIQKALASDSIWTNDWEAQKLPILDKDCESLELDCVRRKSRKTKNSSVSIFMPSQKRKKKNISEEPSRKMQNTTNVQSPSLPPKPVVASVQSNYDSQERKNQRLARFNSAQQSEQSLSFDSAHQRSNNGTFVGYCQDIEKQYLRLTSEPDPLKVRPQHVLEKSVRYVLNKYNNEKGFDYSYFNNQFKSIRQDLTVQHIKNDFAVSVYETHARVAILNNDLGEFNQCQSQLMYLYHLKRLSTNDIPQSFYARENEFTCYRTVYLLITNNQSDICKLRLELVGGAKKHDDIFFKCLEKILQLQAFKITGDYYNFFNTVNDIKQEPSLKLVYHLIDTFMLEKERLKALNTIAGSYRKIPLLHLKSQLRFTEEGGHNSFKEFFDKYKLFDYITDDSDFNCLASRSSIHRMVFDNKFRKVDIKGQI